ncbi:protein MICRORCHIDIA 6-like [Salvia splendens]|nr:protein MICRORCHIDIA 6-like [Salvia splendens]XP_042022806.1 protein MICRORCHIDIA 6-like [Salvia splendens]XP_042022807.1 protein MICRORCHIDIA 6-like [Salvia splendens]XP_042022808.1 protein MICRORCHIDIA 6-like [Salvia splendens]XP_042022809.1 protein MICRORCHIDIA 6-like [Salvia splendens]
MTVEYWDYHCGLIGYKVLKVPRPMTHQVTPSPDSDRGPGIYQPVVLTRDSLPSFHQNAEGGTLRRKRNEQVVEPGRVNRMGGTGVRPVDSALGGDVLQHAINPARAVPVADAAVKIIQDNQKLHAQFKIFEETDKELNLKITKLTEEIQKERHEYARLLLETKMLEKVKRERAIREMRHS